MKITLKEARRMRDKTQDECADILKIHVQTYRKLEENPESVTIKQAKILSDFLGVSYDVLFFRKDTLLKVDKTA